MLELSHLSKRYGSLEALHDLSFTVREGEIFGFVGANGAGKTTTMRIVLGVLDLSTEDACTNLVRATIEQLGGLTVLVNNAVASPDGHDASVADMDTGFWEAALRVNLSGTISAARLTWGGSSAG